MESGYIKYGMKLIKYNHKRYYGVSVQLGVRTQLHYEHTK